MWMLLAFTFFSLPFLQAPEKKEKPWLILFSKNADKNQLSPFNPILLDSRTHPPLHNLKAEKKQLYARVNLSSFFEREEIETFNSILQEKISFILEKHIPSLLTNGFNGIYIDGIDSLSYPKDSNSYRMFVQLVLLMRMYFPGVPFIVRGGTPFLNDIGFSINGLLESELLTTYNPQTNEYQFVSDQEHEHRIKILKKVQREYPALEIFSLDFWDPLDSKTIKQIYKIESGYGFRPYVSTIKLDQIVKGP